jgi:hypothetical protein
MTSAGEPGDLYRWHPVLPAATLSARRRGAKESLKKTPCGRLRDKFIIRYFSGQETRMRSGLPVRFGPIDAYSNRPAGHGRAVMAWSWQGGH